MIDIRKLKELVRLMVENELSELDLRDQQETVTIKRGTGVPLVQHAAGAPAVYAPAPAMAAVPDGNGAAPVDNGSLAPDRPDAPDSAGLVAIESPMVGTFYTAANPDLPPFVTVGAPVGPDTTVCLIEAMKVFNEIKAEVSGRVTRVLVRNGEAVEYDQPLFALAPA
jgi:acetyl-CoA carboxylase biotin carboxyl carrier protein